MNKIKIHVNHSVRLLAGGLALAFLVGLAVSGFGLYCAFGWWGVLSACLSPFIIYATGYVVEKIFGGEALEKELG